MKFLIGIFLIFNIAKIGFGQNTDTIKIYWDNGNIKHLNYWATKPEKTNLGIDNSSTALKINVYFNPEGKEISYEEFLSKYCQDISFPLYNGIYVTKPYYAEWRGDSINNMIRFYRDSVVIYSNTVNKVKNIEDESNWFNIDSLSDNIEYTPTSKWQKEEGKIVWVLDVWKEFKVYYTADIIDSTTLKVSYKNIPKNTSETFFYYYIPISTNLEKSK